MTSAPKPTVLPSPSGPTADYLPVRGGQVHRISAGEAAIGASPLCLLHATAYSGRTFLPLMRSLSGRRTWALDTPGYGASTRPAAPPPLEGYAEILLEALDAAGQPSIDLLGYHTGAFLALEMAARRPDLVRRLILIGVPYFAPGEPREERRRTLAAPMRLTSELGQFEERWRFFVGERPPGVTVEQGYANFVDELRAYPFGFWAHEAAFTYEPTPSLRQVRQPALILNPDNHLSEASRRAAAMMPNADVVEVPELQNAVLDVGAPLLARHVTTFLDRDDDRMADRENSRRLAI